MENKEEIIVKDIEITKRFWNDKEYAGKITKAYCTIQVLKISSKSSYYEYEPNIADLRGVSYIEATYLKRMSNDSYAKKMEELSNIAFATREEPDFHYFGDSNIGSK